MALKKRKRNPEKRRNRREKAAQVLRQAANTVMGAQGIAKPQKKVWMIVPFIVSGTFNLIANIIDPNGTNPTPEEEGDNDIFTKSAKNDQ